MGTFNEYLLSEAGASGAGDYEIYHDSLTSAVQEVEDNVRRQGYEVDPEDIAQKVGFGPRKPTNGETNKYHVKLLKDGEPQKKMVHFQVYDRGTNRNTYELNMYVS